MEADSQAGAGTPFDGTFRLLGELGRGSRGVVFHALQQPLEEPVAIKVLHERLPEDAPGREQFNEEVRAFAGLDHPNLVSISSFGIAGEAPYIVMELLEGETVAARLARGPIDPGEAEALIQSMLRAVAHLHLRGMVHRNLSPSSLFLQRKDDREQLKLIDYGLSRLTENTDTGRVALPSPYLSPEQAAGDDTDARTDVYAAGAIIMRLFGADPPPSAANDNASMRPAARVHPGASPQLDALVARALAPNRQERFGNADQMLKALLELPSPWIDVQGGDEAEEHAAIPIASNAPASAGETAEVSLAEEAPPAARHNTPPPIPEAKKQPLPVLKMIAAALVGAVLAGGGVAVWVARKEAAQKPAETAKVAAKPDTHGEPAKKAEPQAASAQPEPPKPDEPLLKVEEESDEEEAEQAKAGGKQEGSKQAAAEKTAADERTAAHAEPSRGQAATLAGAQPARQAQRGDADAKGAQPANDKTPAAHGADTNTNKAPQPANDKTPAAHGADTNTSAPQPANEKAPAAHGGDTNTKAPRPANEKAPAAHGADTNTKAPQAVIENAPAAHGGKAAPPATEKAPAANSGEPKPKVAPSGPEKRVQTEQQANAAAAKQTATTATREPAPPQTQAAKPPEAPPPPIGAERHVKPNASEIRALLTLAQQPRKPRAKPKDPWEDVTMPTALETLRRSIDRGDPGTPHQISALRHYNGANPDDVHGHLLLAGLYKNRGWDADALDEYDMAYQIDSSARGAPEMLPHALYMIEHDEAVDDATRFIVRAYQKEALTPIDRAIRDSTDPAATGRLKKLRARVRAGR